MKKIERGSWLENDQGGENGLVGIIEKGLIQTSPSHSGAWELEVTGLGCPPLEISYFNWNSFQRGSTHDY